jgi:hypothetical protein
MASAVAVLWFVAAGAAAEPLRKPMNFRRSEVADRVAPTYFLNLKLDVTYVFETRNLSRGSDTVLVVLEEERPVAWNDDRDRTPADRVEPAESRLEFTPKRRVPHAIQLRAKDGSLPGRCDLFMDGRPLAKDLQYGARWKLPKREPMPMPHPEKGAPQPELPIYDLPRRSR